jgi:NAD+ synthase (glutamine-hydrolysing)
MKLVKTAAAVINQTPFDWTGNVNRLRELLVEAKSKEISVLCLPELSISGYGCEDAFYMPHLCETAISCLEKLLPFTKGMIVGLGLPYLHRGALFNTIAVVVDGRLTALVPKKLLAGDGVHYEPRWFKAWPSGVVEKTQILDQEIPIGDLFLDCGGVKLGFEICEEAWAANRPGANLARLGVDIVMNPSASHFAFGKRQVRERFVSEGSRAFNVAYLYSNLLGNESGRIIFDGGALIASEGSIVVRGPRFSYKDFEISESVVDVEVNRMMRARTGSFQPLVGDESKHKISTPFPWPKIKGAVAATTPVADHWENSSNLKAEEFNRAVSLGLFDFLRKSKLDGFTISLSGGVDSAAATVLAVDAIRFAAAELGLDGLKTRLSHIKSIQAASNLDQIIGALISCAYQSTANSSAETESAASELAHALNVQYYHWSVGQLVDEYKRVVANATGAKWAWAEHDVVLQNIQARARGPGIWMLANLRNHLLLATSNRSEAAVGYATMDGDTCGGLSPLAGIDKAYLRQWLLWRQNIGPHGLMPVTALQKVNKIPPTAELRPPEFSQTDEKDLMPYDVLDVIERAAIRDKKSPLDVLATLDEKFPKYSDLERRTWVKRFFSLWCRNQWKRERYAPGFHLDDESLDPKTWCRFPILSGAFEDDLLELDLR